MVGRDRVSSRVADRKCSFAAMASTVLQRVRRFYDARLWRHIAATLPPQPSEEDVVLALAAVLKAADPDRRRIRGPLARR